MDRAGKPLGELLAAIAAAITHEANAALPQPDPSDNEGGSFRQTFLPALYENLGERQRPILLLDEFDVLDVKTEGQLSAAAAELAFFPFLRQLMQGEPRLGFVCVIGRRAEELTINAKMTFKASLYQRVSVLDEQSARELITTAQREGSLTFTFESVERILEITSGHPYFTQLLCQILWDNVYNQRPRRTKIAPADVDAIILKVIETGQSIFDWIWDGLPPAERVIFAAIAEATDEHSVVTEDKITSLLQSYGIRILTHELDLAPNKLVEWEMLRKIDDGYRFFTELMRRWVALRKQLPQVKDELDRIVPLADNLFRSGEGFYRQRDLENAHTLLRQALRVNLNHLKARLLLGQVLLEQGKLDQAAREFEVAYLYNEGASRYPLIRTLFVLGEDLERLGKDDDALAVYQRLLELTPRETVAEERRAAIWIKRGEEAEKADDLETAQYAYQKAGAQDKLMGVVAAQRKRERDQAIAEARNHERQEAWDQAIGIYQRIAAENPEEVLWQQGTIRRVLAEKAKREQKRVFAEAQAYEHHHAWDQAIEAYQRLVSQEPEDQQWHKAVERVKIEQQLSLLYAAGLAAYSKREWDQAMRSLSEVVHIRPGYKDAATLLARATRKQRLNGVIDWGSVGIIGLFVAALLAAGGIGYAISQQSLAQRILPTIQPTTIPTTGLAILPVPADAAAPTSTIAAIIPTSLPVPTNVVVRTSTVAPTSAFVPTTGELTPITSTSIPSGPINRIIFYSDRNGKLDTYVISPDGTNLQRLTDNPADDAGYSWSSDGRFIVFNSTRDGNWEIYVMNADGTNQHNITNNSSADFDATWSPDDRFIAFTSRRDGKPEIYIMNADGTDQHKIGNISISGRGARWSPDGKVIVFYSGALGKEDIYLMNSDGSDRHNLTNLPSGDNFNPVWSPDGRFIAFNSRRDGNTNVYIMQADGKEVRRLTSAPGDHFGPTWSPDGLSIAFTSSRDGNNEIYTINIDGTNRHRLTNDPSDDSYPTWSPL